MENEEYKNDFGLSHSGEFVNLVQTWKDKAHPEVGSNAIQINSIGMEFLLVDLTEKKEN